ncbi:MAG: hypothetical protein PHW74_03905 [Desulfobacca sp.]|nr:hypothetical protein [Desulfobacca sp.]
MVDLVTVIDFQAIEVAGVISSRCLAVMAANLRAAMTTGKFKLG